MARRTLAKVSDAVRQHRISQPYMDVLAHLSGRATRLSAPRDQVCELHRRISASLPSPATATGTQMEISASSDLVLGEGRGRIGRTHHRIVG